MNKLLIALLIIATVLFIVLILVIEVKKQKSYKNIKKDLDKILEGEKKANEKKNSIHTGDSGTDFLNSLDVVSNLAKRKGK